jgi:cytoskeleton protein RodZ
MSAEPGAEAASTPVAAVPGSTPGALLRLERERRGFSVQQAAEDLHLDAWLIEAIEADRFNVLGAPVYAKGHLRKYALLLGLSPELILERYHALGGTPTEPMPIPATVVAPVPQRRNFDLRVPLGILGGLIALGAIGWAVMTLLRPPASVATPPAETRDATPAPREMESVPQANTSAAPVVAPVVTTPPTTTVAPTTTSLAPTASTNVPKSSPTRAQASPPATVAATTGASAQLRLEFSEPSWTEVYDATGNRLLFDMGTPQRARTVSGEPPLRVILGMASAVTAQVNGRPVDIPQREGRDGARFMVDASGAVQR